MPSAASPGGRVDLRPAFRSTASSVWVVTTADRHRPAGFTATSVSSVSLDPPIISFNLARTASSLPAIEGSGLVAAHLLSRHQHALAVRWAGPSHERFVYDGTWYWHQDGLPALGESLVRLSGDVLSLTEAGDSLVALVEVRRQETGAGAPLLHHDRTFRPLDHDLVGAL